MNSKEILWPDKQLTDQIQKAKEIQRRTLSRRPLWCGVIYWAFVDLVYSMASWCCWSFYAAPSINRQNS